MLAVKDPTKAIAMKSYMRNQFEFLGIPAPQRQQIHSQFRLIYQPSSESELNDWVQILWAQPFREYHHFAMSELEANRNFISISCAEIVCSLIQINSWWDTVDFLASNILGKYYLKYPVELDRVIISWSHSSNIWLNRTAILVQLKFKEKTRFDLLESTITSHLDSEEFFIQKAIGWILREVAKTNPTWVRSFVSTHSLKPLSKREAMKYMN